MTRPTDASATAETCTPAPASSPDLCHRLAKLAGTAAIVAACNGVAAPPAQAMVEAFDPDSGSWQPALVEDLSPGDELRHKGQLYRVDDADILWVGAPTADALSHADAAFTEVTCHDEPLQDDWVLALGDASSGSLDAGAHHARLWEVDDGAQVAFDGRLFLVVDDQPQPTGDVLGRVVKTYERQAPQVIDAVVQYADGQQDTLTGTPNHPFWVPAIGDFVALGALDVGAHLHVRSGGDALLVSKTWRQGDFSVFDVEVQGLHAFYIQGIGGGGDGVLVHNSAASKGVDAAADAAKVAPEGGGGRFIVETKGNTLIEPPGGSTVGSPQGTFVETRFPNQSPAQQLHSPGGEPAHGHGFLEGAGKNKRGPSLDVEGNVVPENSPEAHWPVRQ